MALKLLRNTVFALPSCLFSHPFFLIGPHQCVKHQTRSSTVLCVLMLSVPLRWIWLLLSHNTAVYLESDHYCATLFLLSSSLTSSDTLYLSLSRSVLPLLISQACSPQELQRGINAALLPHSMSSFPTWQLGGVSGKSTRKHIIYKTCRGMQNKIFLSQKHL